jgi:hypothetical protein
LSRSARERQFCVAFRGKLGYKRGKTQQQAEGWK